MVAVSCIRWGGVHLIGVGGAHRRFIIRVDTDFNTDCLRDLSAGKLFGNHVMNESFGKIKGYLKKALKS